MKRPDLKGFAQACYDQNTVAELIDLLRDIFSDQADCRAWKITQQQWREAIGDALLARILDRRDLPVADGDEAPPTSGIWPDLARPGFWRVAFGGDLMAPSFRSYETADVYLRALRDGIARPEVAT